MKRRSWTVAASLALASLAMAGPGWGQGKPDLTVALSSFSTETLDPALGGHIVKYYLSLMFDYLVGTTPDGQPSKDGGLAVRWENSPDHKRWTFHLLRFMSAPPCGGQPPGAGAGSSSMAGLSLR